MLEWLITKLLQKSVNISNIYVKCYNNKQYIWKTQSQDVEPSNGADFFKCSYFVPNNKLNQ